MTISLIRHLVPFGPITCYPKHAGINVLTVTKRKVEPSRSLVAPWSTNDILKARLARETLSGAQTSAWQQPTK